MKLLVSGICGFAGSVVARALQESLEGLQITGFDNLSRKGSETNLEPLRQSGVDVRIGDVRDQQFLGALPRCDWILDCAANPSVLAGLHHSATRELVDQNLYGTINLLELAKSWNSGFILLSTSRVYSIKALNSIPLRETTTRLEPDLGRAEAASLRGLSDAGIREDFPTDPPLSLYGATKLASEILALEYSAAFQFPAWVLRCGVLAGAGQFGKADQGIFSYWIHAWKEGRPLRYIGFGGRGFQVRDCLHPRDLAPLILRLIEQSYPRSGHTPRVMNVAGGIANSLSLAELSTWCRERFGPSLSEPRDDEQFSSRPFDAPWIILDSALAAKEWKWKPLTLLQDILEEIAQHAENHPGWLEKVSKNE